jgi:hypothetical protein
VIEMGLVVGIALLITMAKMPWCWKLRVLSNPVLMDLAIFALLVLIHWGTYSGVMVATVGAMACSGVLWAGRKIYGHYANGKYVRGYVNVSAKVAAK